MLHLVTMTALRPLAGDYLDNRHPNEGESFRTDNVTAEELERHGLACRHYTPPPAPPVKITMPAFRMPIPPKVEAKTEAPPAPVVSAPAEKIYTPPAIEAKMLHPPENKMIRVDGNKVLPVGPPARPVITQAVEVISHSDAGRRYTTVPAPPLPIKRKRGRPPGAKNKPK